MNRTNAGLIISIVVLLSALVYGQHIKQAQSFTRAPAELIRTARVYEDGSYVIEYKDGTSERGCMEGGLCND